MIITLARAPGSEKAFLQRRRGQVAALALGAEKRPWSVVAAAAKAITDALYGQSCLTEDITLKQIALNAQVRGLGSPSRGGEPQP